MNKSGYQPFVDELRVLQGDGNDASYLDRIPPNFEDALIHKLAQEVGTEKPPKLDTRVDMCKCCARPVERNKLKLSCDTTRLYFLGPGYPLFFDFYKYCIIILVILFVTSGDYNIITNIAYGNDCNTTNKDQTGNKNFCVLNWITRASLANKRNDDTLVNIQQMLNLVSILVIIALLQLFRRSQRLLDDECDSSNQTAQDYTLLVKNIPTFSSEEFEGSQEKQLKHFFLTYLEKYPECTAAKKYYDQEKFRSDPNLKKLKRVACVNLCYDTTQNSQYIEIKNNFIVKKQETLRKLHKDSNIDPDSIKMEGDNLYPNNQDLQSIQNEIKIMDEKIKVLEEKFHDGKHIQDDFVGQAFVTFQWEEGIQKQTIYQDLDMIIQQNQTTDWSRFFGESSDLEYKDQFLIVRKAPDPTDVYWDNLNITTRQKMIRRVIGYFMSSIVLLACALAIYYLNTLQVQASLAEQQMQANQTGSHVGIKVLAYIASFIIIIINYLLSFIIRNFAEFFKIIKYSYEGFSTHTGHNISVATLSAFAQFSNSALITFFINTLVLKNTFGTGGLIYNQTYVFLSNAIIPSVIEIADIQSFLKLRLQDTEQKLGQKSVKTQQQLNTLFENPEQNMADRYANILKIMFLTAFYASILPIGIIISCFGLIITYWVSKYNILRRRTIKYALSSELSTAMIENLELVLPVYCLTNFWFEYQFSSGAQVSSFACIGIAVGILNAVLPMQDFNIVIFPMKPNAAEKKPYQDIELTLTTDYPRENPCTMLRARDHSAKIKYLQSQNLKKIHQAQVLQF